MTECKDGHEWIYQQSTYGHYECYCGEILHPVTAEAMLNAAEKLPLRIIESALVSLRDYKFPEEDKYQDEAWVALRAYAKARGE